MNERFWRARTHRRRLVGTARRASRSAPFEGTLSSAELRPASGPGSVHPRRSAAESDVVGGTHLAAVRAATRDRHRRLEARVDPARAFSSRARYRELLSELFGFHAAIHGQLARSAALHFPELGPLPERSLLLAQDLRHLAADPASLPRCSALPATPTAAHTIGALYVIEGSALGGAVLGRMADRQLGLTSTTGAGFFAADADLSQRWKLITTTLEHQGTLDGSSTAIVAGAADTFDCLEAWLCR